MGRNIVIATTTMYSSLIEPRAKLALLTIRAAVKAGYKMVVVDSSPAEVAEAFSNEGAAVLSQDRKQSMGVCVRKGIQIASELAGTEGVVVRMEPEKFSLIDCLPHLSADLEPGKNDIVIPGRKNMKSYPVFQQYAEAMGNLFFRKVAGIPVEADLWFGPRVFLSHVSNYFLDYRGDYGDVWDAIFIPVLRALSNGIHLSAVQVDYVYPEEQRLEEDGNLYYYEKRVKQLVFLTEALKAEAQKLGIV
jgi:hypothetical protein